MIARLTGARLRSLTTPLSYVILVGAAVSTTNENALRIFCVALGLVLLSPILCGRGYRAFIRLAGFAFVLLLASETLFRVIAFGPQGLSLHYVPNRHVYRGDLFDPQTFSGLRSTQTLWLGTEVSLNHEGFRDAERSFQKPTDTFRLVMIGGSISAGMGVPVEDRFSNILERRLNSPSILSRLQKKRVEVINLGQIATYYGNQLFNLKELGLKYQPDLVLLEVSDTIVLGLGRRVGSLKEIVMRSPPSNWWRRLEGDVNGGFYALRAFSYCKTRARSRLESWWRGGPPQMKDEYVESARRVFEKAREIAGSVPVAAFILAEHKSNADIGFDPAEFVQALRGPAAESRIPVLNLEIGARGGGRFLDIYLGDRHPNRFAHQIYGELLQAALLPVLLGGRS